MSQHKPFEPDAAMMEVALGCAENPDTGGLFVLPLLEQESTIPLANRMLRNIRPYPGGFCSYKDLYQVINAYMLHRDKLEPETVASIRKVFLNDSGAGKPIQAMEPGLGSVNHPLSAMALGMIGGEQFDLPEVAEQAYRRLDRFAEIWSQTGSFSEYNSPTYVGTDFVALATMAMYTTNPAAALKAKILQEKLWLEILARYHASVGTLSGPYSRAYHDGTVGGPGIAQFAIRRALGPTVPLWLHLMQTFNHHHDWSHLGAAAAQTYSVPQYLKRMGLHKPFPFPLRCNARCGDWAISGLRFEGGDSDLTSYLSDNFSLGSATRPFMVGGQCENPIAYWRKRAPVKEHTDIKALYIRYVFGDKPAGEHNCYASARIRSTAVLFWNEGRNHVFQHENRAIVLAVPLSLPQLREYVKSMKLEILISRFDDVDEIWVGDRKVESLPTASGKDDIITIKDGLTYLALRPLRVTDFGVRDPVRIAYNGDNVSISLFNYEGDGRGFSVDQFGQMLNGFVLEIVNADEYPSFEAYRKQAMGWAVDDTVDAGGVRSVAWQNAGGLMSLKFDMPSHSMVERQLDGEDICIPMLECPLAKQSRSGRIELNGAVLETDEDVSAYLFADPDICTYVGVNPTCVASPLTLHTPHGDISVDRLGFGKVEWMAGDSPMLNVEAVTLSGHLTLSAVPSKFTVTVNGEDLTSELQPVAEKGPGSFQVGLTSR